MTKVDRTWSGRRVFVTGATGFVGSWLVKGLLERGAAVVALIRDLDDHSELVRSAAIRQISVIRGCLEDYASVERAINEGEIDTVFHLGAQALVGAALRSPLPTFEANIRGTYHVLEASRIHRDLVRAVVIASSDKAYGESETLPYTEAHPLAGRHPYDVSKSCTDLLAATYAHTYGLPIAVARCGNIYGGGDLHWSRIVPGTIRSLLSNERPILRSNGHLVRDYFYVEDAAEAYITLGEQLTRPEVRGQAFNFSDEAPITVLEIVERIQAILGLHHLPPVIEGRAAAEIGRQALSARRAREVLGWRARYGLQEGLKRTISWYSTLLGTQR